MNTNIKQLYEDKEKTIEAFPRIWMPIGSLYWNENDISEDIDKYFIGTWQRVKDVFILAAGDIYVAGSSGGEETHTLTINEMPQHKHSTRSIKDIMNTDSTGGGFKASNGQGNNSGYAPWQNTDMDYIGGNQSHNNMPPYECFYCWKRIS